MRKVDDVIGEVDKILAEKSLAAETSAEVTEAPAAPAEEMVEVPVLDDASGTYVLKSMPVSRANVVMSGQMADREFEGSGAEVLDTEGYDPRFCRYWVNRDQNMVSTVQALEKGYRPTPAKREHLRPSHMAKKVEGWGPQEVITRGDLVLMEIPRHMKEAYDARERAESLRRRDPDRAAERAESIMDAHGVNDRNSGVIMQRNGRDVTYFDAGDNMSHEQRSALLAESLERAQDYARGGQQEAPQSGGRLVFGGFDGPANRGAIPPSRLNVTGRPEL